MRSRILLGLGLVSAAIAAGNATSAPPAVRQTDPIFTVSQAEEGKQLYGERCAMCHGARLEGTYEIPGLTGKFIANWSNRPLSNLFDYVGRAMPQFAPGSLSPEEDARIIAFLMRENGMSPGTQPLPVESEFLKAMKIGPIAPK